MKHTQILMTILALAACGGKRPESAQPSPEPAPAPAPDPEPAPEPPPPPPAKSWRALAALTPVKGAKVKGTTVTFSQTEGKATAVGSLGWFDGIKSGSYHLVVHEAPECGPSATRAGKPGIAIAFFATAGMDRLDVGDNPEIQLDGERTIVGHTLVLHDDKNGKPGKALACGPIALSTE